RQPRGAPRPALAAGRAIRAADRARPDPAAPVPGPPARPADLGRARLRPVAADGSEAAGTPRRRRRAEELPRAVPRRDARAVRVRAPADRRERRQAAGADRVHAAGGLLALLAARGTPDDRPHAPDPPAPRPPRAPGDRRPPSRQGPDQPLVPRDLRAAAHVPARAAAEPAAPAQR